MKATNEMVWMLKDVIDYGLLGKSERILMQQIIDLLEEDLQEKLKI